MVEYVTLGFMLSAFVRQSKCFKKERLILLIFVRKGGVYLHVRVPKFLCMRFKVCFFFNVSMFVLCTFPCTYIYTYICIYNLHIHTYFRCQLVGRGETNEETEE